MKLQHKMTNKSFSLVLLTAFLVLTSLALVSAAVGFLNTNPGVLTKSSNATFTITNTNASNSIIMALSSTSPTLGNVTTSITGTTTVAPNATNTFNVLATLPTDLSLASFPLGSISNSFRISNSLNASDNATVSLTFINGYCSSGSSRNSSRYIEILSIKDDTSENDWKWKPADDVTIKVKVEYRNSADSDDSIDAIIKLELYDTQTGRMVDLDNEDEFERSVGLDEGNSAEEIFELTVPVEDLEDSSDRYRLYVKVYEESKESTLCMDNLGSNSVSSATPADYYKSIEINKKTNEVILKNIEITSPTPCGQEAIITAKAWNIGTDSEDKVYVNAYNSKLGLINLSTGTFSLDEGSAKGISLSFIVPKGLTDGTYDIYLTPFYRYQKNSETYKGFPDEPEKLTLTVNNCKVDVKNFSIDKTETQRLNEDVSAVIGTQVKYTIPIKNNGDVETEYTIYVSGTSDWTSKVTIDPNTAFKLAPGASRNVDIYFDIKSDIAEVDKTFTVSTGYGTAQTFTLSLVKGFSSQAIVNHLQRNWIIYTIVLVNLILIIAIIVAVVRLMRK